MFTNSKGNNELQNVKKNDGERERSRGVQLPSNLSPLQSLDEDVLSQLLGYLDEEGLLAIEEIPVGVNPKILLEHWRRLDEIRSFGSKSASRVSARDRGVRFARAARFAKRMEHLVAMHYDYDECDLRNETVKCQPCEELPDLLEPPVSGYEFFVRMSYRSDSSLIWQGFPYPMDRNGTILKELMIGPEADEFKEWALYNSLKKGRQFEELAKMKHILKNVQVTVVALEKSEASERSEKLVVATESLRAILNKLGDFQGIMDFRSERRVEINFGAGGTCRITIISKPIL